MSDNGSLQPSLHSSHNTTEERLREIADLLCSAHKHKVTNPFILPNKPITHSMVITCHQEDNIIWHVEIFPNCRIKWVRRCRVTSTSRSGQGSMGVMTFEPLSTWEGFQCDDILWLLSIGHLKEGWWEDNPSRWSDEHRDHIGAESEASGSHNYVAYPESMPEPSLAPSQSKDHDSENETQLVRQTKLQ
ncbi:hypothetical protein HOY80DRAFT_1003494 [Tuber brumale]|nr:hypothetical protein HOY80DRAFT_1003494 [Tuber brumale]